MRVDRLKSNGAVAQAVRHNLRLREVPNADIERSQDNATLPDETLNKVMGRLRGRLDQVDRKIRPDAVRAVEYVITRSGDAKHVDDKKYFEDALKWVEKKHGKENVISVVAHMDEDVPHTHMIVVPLTQKENKKGQKVTALSAKDFFSGKQKLSALQTEFYEQVGAKNGLSRGEIKPRKSRHIPLKEFYRMEAGRITEDIDIGKIPLTKREEWKKNLEKKIEGSLDRAYAKGIVDGKEGVENLREQNRNLQTGLMNNVFNEKDLEYTKDQNKILRGKNKQLQEKNKDLTRRVNEFARLSPGQLKDLAAERQQAIDRERRNQDLGHGF